MNPLFFPFAFIPLICALQYEDEFPERKINILCDLGCKCAAEGQALAFFDCSLLDIKTFPESMEFLSPITKLSFQGNKIASLAMDTFSRADAIEELDLSLNKITDIEDYTFVPFKSLAELKLSHNRLSDLAPGLFEGLSNLMMLELGHNAIKKIVPSTFQATPNLQELRLQYNPIFDLPEQLLQYLPRLEKLDLQETGLARLPSNLFTPTPRLQWLSLSSNAFEIVPQTALAQAPMLERLDLSGNDFTILTEGAFQGLSNVTILFLNNLPELTRIEKNALVGLDKLKTFACSYNPKLAFIHQDAFGSENSTLSEKKTPPREQLHLRQNALRTLESPLQKEALPMLSFVDLTDNPWHCDCKLEWMAFLRKEHQMNVVCSSPSRLKGRSFDTIANSELKCDKEWDKIIVIAVISSVVAFGIIAVGLSAVVCSRTSAGLYVRAKKQFSYAKVVPSTETVDLEWDPSAETI